MTLPLVGPLLDNTIIILILIILYLCLNVLFLEIYLSKHFCFDLKNLISRVSDKSKFCNGPINFEIKRFNCTNMQLSEKI
jgi:hypothetical protein